MTDTQFGKLVKQYRNAKGSTQESIAKKVGITRGAFANIENGYNVSSFELKTKIAKILRFDFN